MSARTLLRIGAVAVILGVIIFYIADSFHGGHEPDNLVVTLPQYAANTHWVTVHLGQFIGQFLVAIGVVALYRSITVGPGAALALLGFFTTLVSIST